MPEKKKTQKVQFRLQNAHAEEVFVSGSFNKWDPSLTPLQQTSDDEWETILELEPGTYEYRYLIDEEWASDAEAPLAPNLFGSENCLLGLRR